MADCGMSAPAPAIMGFKAIEREAITIDFEMEAEEDFTALQDVMRTKAPVLKPMPMAPITAVDDLDFIPALKANVNLPTYLKQAL